jgi:hypothetical protein
MATSIPSEFAEFVRDVAGRAFETLSERVDDLDKPLRGVVRSWAKLGKRNKQQLLNHLISAARGEEFAPAEKKSKKKKNG